MQEDEIGGDDSPCRSDGSPLDRPASIAIIVVIVAGMTAGRVFGGAGVRSWWVGLGTAAIAHVGLASLWGWYRIARSAGTRSARPAGLVSRSAVESILAYGWTLAPFVVPALAVAGLGVESSMAASLLAMIAMIVVMGVAWERRSGAGRDVRRMLLMIDGAVAGVTATLTVIFAAGASG